MKNVIIFLFVSILCSIYFVTVLKYFQKILIILVLPNFIFFPRQVLTPIGYAYAIDIPIIGIVFFPIGSVFC